MLNHPDLLNHKGRNRMVLAMNGVTTAKWSLTQCRRFEGVDRTAQSFGTVVSEPMNLSDFVGRRRGC